MESLPILVSNPQAGYFAYKKEVDQAVQEALESGWYILGKQVTNFETEFAHYIGSTFCIGVGSGTDALQVALRALGIGPGDSVITVSHTAVATVSAIDLTGAVPILVDIDPGTYTIDINRLEETIKNNIHAKIKAIIPVHLYGHPADMSAIMDVANRYRLWVIEDCAQAHGAALRGTKVGSIGHVGAFSFYPTKNLGALGDGGALVTQDADLANRIQLVRQYGWKERYVSDICGLNSRLDELQAAVLRIKLKYLDKDNMRRRAIAHLYDSELSSTDLILPEESPNAFHVYHQYVIRIKERDSLKTYLQTGGIGTSILYPMPIHMQPAYRNRIIIGAGGLPVTERVCQEILSLPIYPELQDEQLARVVEKIREWQFR